MRTVDRAALCTELALIAALAGCSSAPPPAAASSTSAEVVVSDVARFLPSEPTTVLAYETQSASGGERGLLVLEVRRPRPDVAELVVAGRTRRLAIDGTGLRHVTGGWLLKPPLVVGATFRGDFGTVRVTAVDRTVELPAGTFAGCVETTEAASGQGFQKQTVTLFCPSVGIVARRTEAESDEGAGFEAMTLRSYGAPVDLVPR